MSTLEAYLRFAQAHPTLFTNPPEGGFAILLDKNEIRGAELQTAQRLETRGLPREWARVGIAYQDQYLLILRDAVRFPDGSLGTYIRQVSTEEDAPGVAVFPLYHGQVLLLRHFRHATRAWHLEIPRGFGIKGSSSEENAARELAEEINGSFSQITSLGVIYPDTGMRSSAVALFFAQVTAYGEVEAQEAIVQIVPVALPEFEQMVLANEVTDPFAIVAYTRAKLQGLLSSTQ